MKHQPCILIIDDDPKVCVVVSDVLRDMGYQILVAQDGEEGLKMVEEEKPDLIILDIMMPKIDGYEVCRRLRSERKTWYIPILMLTARGQIHEEKTGYELGTNDYMSKPYNNRELEARVKALLRRYPPLQTNNQDHLSSSLEQKRTNPKYLAGFHELLAYRYSVGELRTLCLKLGVDYEDLEVPGKSNTCRELIMYFERRGSLTKLVDAVMKSRPNVSWDVDDS